MHCCVRLWNEGKAVAATAEEVMEVEEEVKEANPDLLLLLREREQVSRIVTDGRSRRVVMVVGNIIPFRRAVYLLEEKQVAERG